LKTIAIVTSGGDAPGMNAAIRAVTRIAYSRNLRVIGFERGWEGLINGIFRPLTPRSVGGIIQLGGYKGRGSVGRARDPPRRDVGGNELGDELGSFAQVIGEHSRSFARGGGLDHGRESVQVHHRDAGTGSAGHQRKLAVGCDADAGRIRKAQVVLIEQDLVNRPVPPDDPPGFLHPVIRKNQL